MVLENTEENLILMKTKTFDEWKKEGYYVRAGEHAVGRNKRGVSVFSEEQVERDRFEEELKLYASEYGFDVPNR